MNDDKTHKLEDLLIDEVSLCGQGMNPLADVLLYKAKDVEKADRLPNPDMSEKPYVPVTSPDMAFVDLDAARREHDAILASGRLGQGTFAERQALKTRFDTLHRLLRVAGHADEGGGPKDSPHHRWNGESIRVNADGTRSKVITEEPASQHVVRPTVTKAAVGSLLRSKRIEKGLSQQKLADVSGCSLRSVAAWEAGECAPSALKGYAVACALDLSDDERDMLHRAMRERG